MGSNKITVIEARPAGEAPPDKPVIRAAAYCRVSTEMEEQQNSLQAQVAHYTAIIEANPLWENAGVFAESGVSGTSGRKRTEFQKMLRKCKRGLIDIILTKSISRFYRNYREALECLELLSSLGVNVIFEKEGIDTASNDKRLMMNLLLILAQAESEAMGRSIQWSYTRRFQKGTYQHINRTHGYHIHADGTLEIDEKESKIVRRIFQEYLDGFSHTEIAQGLTDDHIPTAMGRAAWRPPTISKILCNDTYAGDVIRQKTYTVDSIAGERRRNNGERHKYHMEDAHPPIIDRTTFQRAAEERARRKSGVRVVGGRLSPRRYHAKHALTDQLICGWCKDHYIRTNHRGRSVWRCHSRARARKGICPDSETLQEKALYDTILKTVSIYLSKHDLYDAVSHSPYHMEGDTEGMRERILQSLRLLQACSDFGELEDPVRQAMNMLMRSLIRSIEILEGYSLRILFLDDTEVVTELDYTPPRRGLPRVAQLPG